MPQDNIRNFCIIAHIDHGKSTLADRILENTNAVAPRDMEEQLLDNMDIERERGITIKSRAVRLHYNADDGKEYVFNLIDTPGHVDFNYEVSRSLAACEGAVLIVDASQGVEAQTLANAYLAVDHDLEIVPVINKIDLPAADPDRVAHEIEDIIGIPALDAPRISAKTGENVHAVLEAIVEGVPAPKGEDDAPLKALIFDSVYDSYRGVIVYVRVMDGSVKNGDRIRMMATGAEFDVVEVGYMGATRLVPSGEIKSGEVGYITASIKTVADTAVGDASLSFEPETSAALGFGFRCGFLGLLHMEVILERLEREYSLDLITTAPSVVYKLHLTDGTTVELDNPTNYPDPATIESSEEPYVIASIFTPTQYIGSIMDLCQQRRGIYRDTKYLEADRAELHYELPLGEIIYDFFDALKSRTRGYASFDYEPCGYKPGKLVKLDVLLNGEQVDALSMIVFAENAYPRARRMVERLRDNISRQLFEVPVQAAIGGKIIARETVKALRKDVLAKCYGGDITRKKKLLEKQKEGKKKMRRIGSVELPKEAFMAVLKLDDD